MLIESLAASMIVGKIRGGKLSDIGDEKIKGWQFIVSSFILEYGAVFFAGRGFDIVKNNIFYIHSFTYLLLLIGLLMNIKKPTFCIIVIGVLLNLAVILANGGQMPVSQEALEKVGLFKNIALIGEKSDIVHKLMAPSDNLKFLADIFPMGRKGFLPSVVSIGDIIMSIGVFLYIQRLMTRKKARRISRNS